DSPSDDRLIPLGNDVLHRDVQIRQSVEENGAHFSKLLRPTHVATFHVTDRIRRHQLIDRLLATSGPNLLKPTAGQPCSLLFWHDIPPSRNLIADPLRLPVQFSDARSHPGNRKSGKNHVQVIDYKDRYASNGSGTAVAH